MNVNEEKRLLKKLKILLEKNLSLQEIETSLGILPLEEKSEEILELAYQVFQDEEYAKLHNYTFGNTTMNFVSKELTDKIDLLLDNGINGTNIEDYAIKYYVENLYHQMRR